jgi:hypothetical protein
VIGTVLADQALAAERNRREQWQRTVEGAATFPPE